MILRGIALAILFSVTNIAHAMQACDLKLQGWSNTTVVTEDLGVGPHQSTNVSLEFSLEFSLVVTGYAEGNFLQPHLDLVVRNATENALNNLEHQKIRLSEQSGFQQASVQALKWFTTTEETGEPDPTAFYLEKVSSVFGDLFSGKTYQNRYGFVAVLESKRVQFFRLNSQGRLSLVYSDEGSTEIEEVRRVDVTYEDPAGQSSHILAEAIQIVRSNQPSTIYDPYLKRRVDSQAILSIKPSKNQ